MCNEILMVAPNSKGLMSESIRVCPGRRWPPEQSGRFPALEDRVCRQQGIVVCVVMAPPSVRAAALHLDYGRGNQWGRQAATLEKRQPLSGAVQIITRNHR